MDFFRSEQNVCIPNKKVWLYLIVVKFDGKLLVTLKIYYVTKQKRKKGIINKNAKTKWDNNKDKHEYETIINL